MNANFGLFPPLAMRVRDKQRRYEMLAERALNAVRDFAVKLRE
jgi:methylenetetrahydrofolate--tRNA-(uracil-5-)-methyltransferase